MKNRPVPAGVQIIGRRKFGTHEALSMDVPEVAALLRCQLKAHYPQLRCTVRVTHRRHGWLRVRANGAHDAMLATFVRSFALLNYDGMTDESHHHIGLLDIDGTQISIANSVRWVELEWA